MMSFSKFRANISVKQSRNPQNQMLPRRNTEPLGNADGSSLSIGLRESSMVADRRSTISIYILCRVLIEVIGQTTLECVTEDMADKLEDIIFNQLRSADPDTLLSSPLRMANWTLFGQLLGVMSSIDFERVTDRFFADLEKIANTATKDTEARVELIVKGMSYIKLKVHILRLHLIPPTCSRENEIIAIELQLTLGFQLCDSFSLKVPYRNPPTSWYPWPISSSKPMDSARSAHTARSSRSSYYPLRRLLKPNSTILPGRSL